MFGKACRVSRAPASKAWPADDIVEPYRQCMMILSSLVAKAPARKARRPRPSQPSHHYTPSPALTLTRTRRCGKSTPQMGRQHLQVHSRYRGLPDRALLPIGRYRQSAHRAPQAGDSRTLAWAGWHAVYFRNEIMQKQRSRDTIKNQGQRHSISGKNKHRSCY